MRGRTEGLIALLLLAAGVTGWMVMHPASKPAPVASDAPASVAASPSALASIAAVAPSPSPSEIVVPPIAPLNASAASAHGNELVTTAAPPSADAGLPAREALRASYAAAPDIVWGVNGHPFTAYPGVSIEDQLDAVQRLGMTHYRVDIRPVADVSRLDRLLSVAEKRGITILPIIAVDVSLDKDTPERIYKKAHEIARGLAKRYAGRVRVWELGNELENYAIIQPCEMRDDGTKYPCEWGPAGGVGPLEYYGPRWKKVSALMRGMSDGVHEGDPAALRAMGTAGWGHSGAFDRMRDDGVQWDISVWHQYEAAQDVQLQHVASFGKPIWITEFNYSGGSTKGEKEQAEGLTQMTTRHRVIRAPYRVEAVFIYELFDEPYWTGMESVMGLIKLKETRRGFYKPGEPKAAFSAVRDLIAAGPRGAAPPSAR